MSSRPTCYVFRPTKSEHGRTRKVSTYTAVVGLPGQRPIRIPTGFTDKRAAQSAAREALRSLEHEAVGLTIPKPRRLAAERALLEHVDDYLASLSASGRSVEYVRIVGIRLRRLAESMKLTRLCDVTIDAWERWRLSNPSLAPATVKHYRDTWRGLLRWLVECDRLDANPLERARLPVQGVDVRRVRRALSPDEQRRLLDIAGPRRDAYLLVLRTGLRRSEVLRLVWTDLELDDDRPLLRLRAAATKAKRADVLPLAPDVADMLRRRRSDAAADPLRVFPVLPEYETLHRDFERAKIPRRTPDGRVVDFHALRTTFITEVQKRSPSPAVSMRLARHTDYRLTQRVYTDPEAMPTREIVERLPRYDHQVSPVVVDGGSWRASAGVSHGVRTGRVVSNPVATDIAESSGNIGVFA